MKVALPARSLAQPWPELLNGTPVTLSNAGDTLRKYRANSIRSGRLQRFVRRRLSWARSRMPMKDKDCEGRNEPATLTERGLAAIQSPRKPNGLSHCIFECLIVEASSQAQNHLSVLADRYTERCRGVFDCTGDG